MISHKTMGNALSTPIRPQGVRAGFVHLHPQFTRFDFPLNQFSQNILLNILAGNIPLCAVSIVFAELRGNWCKIMDHAEMSPILSRKTFLELLLSRYCHFPIWAHWDGNTDALIADLQKRLQEDLREIKKSHAEERYDRTINFILWLLDQLMPMDEDSAFTPFLGKDAVQKLGLIVANDTTVSELSWSRAVYAWTRRRKVNERHLIFQDQELCYDEAMAGWAETCPRAEAETLFDWVKFIDSSTEAYEVGWWNPNILISEFRKRVPDPKTRSEIMIPLAQKEISRLELQSVNTPLSDIYLYCLLLQIAEDIAYGLPAPEESLPSEDKYKGRGLWQNWFLSSLTSFHLDNAKDLFERVFRMSDSCEHIHAAEHIRFPVYFWVHRHDSASRANLIKNALTLELIVPCSVIDYIGGIIPPSEFHDWDSLIWNSEFKIQAIIAYIRWVKPEYREALQKYFMGDFLQEGDYIMVPAFQAYLHLTPRPLLMALQSNGPTLPYYQNVLLDRMLYAPEPLRPKAHVWGIQAIENDARLGDPMSFLGI